MDDGSNACIDVKIARKAVSRVEPGESNTAIKNLQVESSRSSFDILIDGKEVDIGKVIKAKCTLSSFRGVRQLDLKRVWVISNTNEEVALWKDMANFKRDVLSHPWILTKEDEEKVDRQVRDDERLDKTRERKLKAEARARSERHRIREEKRSQHEGRVEQRRREAEARYNTGALPGTDLIWR